MIFLRELFNEKVVLEGKLLVILILGSFYLVTLLTLIISTILVVKFDSLIYKENIIITAIFKGLGQIMVINNYILFLPSLVIFENAVRCNNSEETLYSNK